jgi:pimeloyl-ACP methyl ester carboxylesterase
MTASGDTAEKGLRGTWTRVNGLMMYARVSDTAAPAGRPAVVLVHGLGVSGTYMVPTAERLAVDHAVYVPDLPGYGKSERPPHTLYVPELADALAAWVRAAGPRRATYLGNSLGCQTIIDFALRHPDLIDRAVLIGPTGDTQALTLLQHTGRGVLDLVCEPLSLYWILVRDYWTLGPIRTVLTLQSALEDRLEAKLPHVQVPTLILRGARDTIATQDWVDHMQRVMPRAQVVALPHAPHAANYAAPDAVAGAVRRFLYDVGSGSPANGAADRWRCRKTSVVLTTPRTSPSGPVT